MSGVRWSRVARTALAIAAAAVALIALGWLDLSRRPPAQIVLSAGSAWDYVRTVERRVAQAQRRVWVMVYVMRLGDAPDPDHPVEILGASLAAAHERGLDVRVCLDRSKNWEDPELIDPKHVLPARWLRDRGVRVVEDDLERISHAKVVLIDDDIVILGSHNWTFSALTLNREASVLLRDRDLLRELERELFGFIPGWDEASSLPPTGGPEVEESERAQADDPLSSEPDVERQNDQ